MTGHIPLKVTHHQIECLVVERKVIRVYSEHLLPALASGMLQVHIDIGERLVDLCVDIAIDYSSRRGPASCCEIVNRLSLEPGNSFRLWETYLGLRIRYGPQCERPGCTRNVLYFFGRRGLAEILQV